MNGFRDVLHVHVLPRHCPVCAGRGRIGDHRWTVTPSGRHIRAKAEPCPRCKGTGKPAPQARMVAAE
jgi:DnaJ-class molecular chaperone